MTLKELEKKRELLHSYIIMKLDEKDYHAVCDASMDLRELQVRIDILGKSK